MQNRIAKNIITGFGGQLVTIILGIIVPRIVIINYGSDTNGLLNTITQVFTYMALLEAGIGQAASNVLYRPVKENNAKEINEIVSIAQSYFRRVTVVYGIGVLLLALALPLVIKTEIDYITVALIVLFEGGSGVISFYFIQTPSILMTVDGKGYVNNEINLINRILGYIGKITMAMLGASIVFLQLIYFLITVAKVFFYIAYFRRNYSWVCYKKVSKGEKLKDRNSFVLTEIAWTIFSSTDMVVLSMFMSTKESSVYSVYNLVFSSVTMVINAVYNSVSYVLWTSYHGERKVFIKIYDSFNSIFLGITTVLMCSCYMLVIPFISLYTYGVSDVEYVYESLPLMFCIIQILSRSRYVSGGLTGISGYAKQTSYVSMLEAIINLTFSIVFVRRFGIVGVTFATVIALPVKVIWCVYLTEKKVLMRSCRRTVSIMAANYAMFFLAICISRFIKLSITSYSQFILWGCILTIFWGGIGIAVNILVNKECWETVRHYIFRH